MSATHARRGSAPGGGARRLRAGAWIGLAWVACAAAPTVAAQPGSRTEPSGTPAAAPRAAVPPFARSPAADLRDDYVRKGEAALARGDHVAAQSAFDLAAALSHDAVTELGLVRTYMQAGDYRRAVSFGAHTSGVHRDVAGGAALYAWLLHLGGQTAFARRLIDERIASRGADPLLDAVRVRLAPEGPDPGAAELQPPARLAPYATGPEVPTAARVVATATRLPGTALAIAPRAVVAPGARLWVRDGLGRTRAADPAPGLDETPFVLLQLQGGPLAAGPVVVAPGPVFPGSGAYAVSFAPRADAEAAWPRLDVGFLGAPVSSERVLRLGLPTQAGGGPVFDLHGRWTGVVAIDPATGPLFVPVALLRSRGLQLEAGAPGAAAGPAGNPRARVSVDEVYERALPLALQVLSSPDGG